MATGRLTLKVHAIVTDVVYDRDRKRATGVRVLDAHTQARPRSTRAKVVFLCASTLNSTWILMRSATDVWPGGLGSSSGELGHNLMDHHFRCGANGTVARVRGSQRLRPPADRLLHPALPQPRRRQARVPARLRLPGQRQPPGLGARGRRARRRRRVQGRDGDARPVAHGRHGVRRDAAEPRQPRSRSTRRRSDKWGLPVLAIDCATGENERLMRRDMMNDMAEMLEATGVKDVRVYDNGYFPGMGIHEMGTARMGRDPKTSVLNAHNQVWDCTERLRHRRLVHDLGGVPEPVAHLHGAHGARGGVRRRRAEARQPVNGGGRRRCTTDIDRPRWHHAPRGACSASPRCWAALALVGGDRLLGVLVRRRRRSSRRWRKASARSPRPTSRCSTRSPRPSCRRRRRPAPRRPRPAPSWR